MRQLTMALTPDMPLAAIALRGDAYATVLDRHGLDFCCGGRRTLAAACAAAKLDATALLQEMADEVAARAAPTAETVWEQQPLPALIQHLLQTHHVYTREAIARIRPLVAKVNGRHADRHPGLPTIALTFETLANELESHMLREERVLFPYVVAIASGRPFPPAPFGTLANPVRVMVRDHENAAVLLEDLRASTNAFTPPEGACSSYQALYAALAELRRDLLVHVALENNVLFPRALALLDRGEPRSVA